MLDPPKQVLWWQGEVRLGNKANGYWPVRIARAGVYRFEVRRWPACVEAPMAGAPAESPPDETIIEQEQYRLPPCRALPVAAVRLEVSGRSVETSVGQHAAKVSFDLALEPGPADVRATLLDRSGQEISGAYYVYVFRTTQR
jgi:hypothetical protein